MLERTDKNSANKKEGQKQRSSESTAHSLQLILNLVRTEGAMTRQEIERSSEMGRAIVTDRLSTLSRFKLIDDSGVGTTTGGRAPKLLKFNANAGRFLVATIEQNTLGVGISDLSGELLTEHHEQLNPDQPVSNAVNRISDLFDWLIDRQDRNTQLWGIGLSVPGPVQVLSNAPSRFETPPMQPLWNDVPIVERILSKYQVPVWVHGSVEAMAMGEVRIIEPDADETILFVKVGSRIGASLISSNTLYCGTQGLTGLIGHTPVHTDAGHRSLEAVAGAQTVAEKGQLAAATGKSAMLAEILERNGVIEAIDVCRCAQNADHEAMDILSQSGRSIGQTLAGLTNMLNPSRIILSGSMVQGNDVLLAAVREMVYRNAHPLTTRDLQISSSQLGSSAGLIGAGAVAAGQLFAPRYLKQWVSWGHPSADPEFQSQLEKLQTRFGDFAEPKTMPPSQDSQESPK